jgi:hypothetical protein
MVTRGAARVASGYARLAAIAALSLAAAGCAIPTQGGPSAIAPAHVPFGLLDPQPPTTTTTLPSLSSLVPVKIYLLSVNQQLVAVNRVVVSPAPLSSVLTSLLAGPTSSETDNGTTTAIPNDVVVLSAVAQGAIVTVNFNQAFGAITGASTELAVAQVVATIAAQNGPDTGVIFEIDGQSTSVPIASGAQVPGPVYILQFVVTAS